MLHPFFRSITFVTLLICMNSIPSSAPAPSSPSTAAFGPQNPFFAPSPLPFHAPPFDRIRDEDYQPAIEAGMAEQQQEILAIASNPAPPTFDNTFVALERSGQLLQRAQAAFDVVTGANTNPYLQNVQREIAPKLAAHSDAILLNPELFARIRAIYDRRASLDLSPESRRLVEILYDRFVHAGAALSDPDKEKLKKLNEEAAILTDEFSRGLLEATKKAAFTTPDRTDLAGLSEIEIAAAAAAAEARGLSGYLLPLQNTTQQPALADLTDRDTRQALFAKGWTRAEQPGGDLRPTIARLAQLRAEKARLLGFSSYAAWKLEDQMAKTPAQVFAFLDQLIPVATAKAHEEAAAIQAVIERQQGGFTLQPWDWDFYAEQVRKAKYDLDESQLKPYFELNSVLENGVLYAAHQLYGLTFTPRTDIPVWHPQVRVFEVREADGTPLSLFYFDPYKRDNKNGGAWMSSFVDQSRLLGQLPVIYNVANLPQPVSGEPTLLTFDEVTTLFHEFGHTLHGMLSDVEFPSLSGTAVPRDFVEFPSQINEHWALHPDVLHHYARHYQSGDPMPDVLAEKIRRARVFNQGYAFTELLAASMLDMQWHTLPSEAPLQEVDAFERSALDKSRVAIPAVPPRYRTSYFRHIWTNGYAAGYYAYQWAEMLDADGYRWFDEHGGLTRENGDRFRRGILSRGNTEDPAGLYAAWRGRPPQMQAMLQDRGLASK